MQPCTYKVVYTALVMTIGSLVIAPLAKITEDGMFACFASFGLAYFVG